ncbi:MAG: nucleotidyltransferase domain-containing protein [archaeon]|nr:nucleotidyltransferase domain-containing protein [archaeon]
MNDICVNVAVLGFLNPQVFIVLDSLAKQKCYLRELAHQTRLAPSTVHGVLSVLKKNKMVVVKTVMNRKEFELNYSSPLTVKAISFLYTQKVLQSRAFAKLVHLKPVGIYLFGTAHSGKITATSDIDLAVFFEKKPDSFKLSQIKTGLGNELKREIDLVVLTREKIESMREQKTELLNQVLYKSTLLWGEPIESS